MTQNTTDESAATPWFRKISLLSAPLLLGQLLSKGLNFVVFYLITQFLGLDGFGIWVWAFSLVAVAAAAWSFGLQTWLAKTSAKLSKDLTVLPDLFRKIILIRVGALVLVSLGALIWLFFVGVPTHTNTAMDTVWSALFAIFVGFLFRTSGELCRAYLRGQLKTWPDGMALFTTRLTFVVLLLVSSIENTISLQDVSVCFCLSEIVGAILLLFLFLRHTSGQNLSAINAVPLMPWRHLIHEVSLYGGLLLASAFLFRIGVLFGGHHLSASDIGALGVIHRLNEFSLFLPEALAAVLLPLWTRSQSNINPIHATRTVLFMAVGGLTAGLGVMLLGPWVLPILFEQEYGAVIPWLWVTVPLFALQFTNHGLLAQLWRKTRRNLPCFSWSLPV